jgi:hypothetical protein
VAAHGVSDSHRFEVYPSGGCRITAWNVLSLSVEFPASFNADEKSRKVRPPGIFFIQPQNNEFGFLLHHFRLCRIADTRKINPITARMRIVT